MCIAAYVPKGITSVTEETLRNCFSNNDDGAGFIIPEPGNTRIYKGFFNEDAFVNALMPFLKANEYGVVFHCRIATHGATDKHNCHPHRVQGRKDAFVHNGILSIMAKDKENKDSDSVLFGRWCFAQLPADWFKNAVIVALIEEAIGRSNKIVYVAESGEVTILNEKGGDWVNGVWYSNHTHNYRKHVYTQAQKYVYNGDCGQGFWESEYGCHYRGNYKWDNATKTLVHKAIDPNAVTPSAPLAPVETGKRRIITAEAWKQMSRKKQKRLLRKINYNGSAHVMQPTCAICCDELDARERLACAELKLDLPVCVAHCEQEQRGQYLALWDGYNANKQLPAPIEGGIDLI